LVSNNKGKAVKLACMGVITICGQPRSRLRVLRPQLTAKVKEENLSVRQVTTPP